jgi:type VI secretion system secreted protein Hcp
MKNKMIIPCIFYCLCITINISGQQTIFLKLDGIEGNTVHKDYKGWIQVTGLEQSTSNAISFSTGGGAGAGKVKFGEFIIKKAIDKTSASLLLNTATGRHLRQAVVAFAGFDGIATYTITLSDVVLSGITTSSECKPNCITTEQVSLSFAKTEWVYKDKNGTITKGGWDTVRNTAIN